jgi:hypothetical protein
MSKWNFLIALTMVLATTPELHAARIIEDCKTGQYRDFDAACKKAPRGSYAKNNELFPCEPGSHQDRNGKARCKPCDKGAYQDEVGQSFCKLCPAGSFQDSKRATGCNWSTGIGVALSEGQAERKYCADPYEMGMGASGDDWPQGSGNTFCVPKKKCCSGDRVCYDNCLEHLGENRCELSTYSNELHCMR